VTLFQEVFPDALNPQVCPHWVMSLSLLVSPALAIGLPDSRQDSALGARGEVGSDLHKLSKTQVEGCPGTLESRLLTSISGSHLLETHMGFGFYLKS
jgi:hypothetical protein